MRTATAVGAAAFALALVGTSTASAAPAIPMSGAQESAAGDADGHGFFSYTLDGTELCWSMSWERVETATAAHIHVAPRHVAGPVVVPLDVGDGSGAPVAGCEQIDAELAAAISTDPGAYYVNVHNAPFPGGAIRGQLK